MLVKYTHLIMAGLLLALLMIKPIRALESCTQSNSLKQTTRPQTHRFSTHQSLMHLETSG